MDASALPFLPPLEVCRVWPTFCGTTVVAEHRAEMVCVSLHAVLYVFVEAEAICCVAFPCGRTCRTTSTGLGSTRKRKGWQGAPSARRRHFMFRVRGFAGTECSVIHACACLRISGVQLPCNCRVTRRETAALRGRVFSFKSKKCWRGQREFDCKQKWWFGFFCVKRSIDPVQSS